jgi:hypothetical protein
MVLNRNSTAILVTIVVILVIGLLATYRPVESSDTGPVGRFQLVAGCYESRVGQGLPGKDDTMVTRGGIFKIDTMTGETWVLTERIDTQSIIDDEITRRWEPID